MQAAAVIFAAGPPCPADWAKQMRKGKFAIALDGAANIAREQGWTPDLIAGDFDAISRATYRHFEKTGVPFLPTPDQSYTDLEKALAWCVLRGFLSVTIVQGLGGRLDHSFTNLSLLKRYHSPKRELRLQRPGETVRFLQDEEVILRGKPGRSIALLPFPSCRASSRGLLFELDRMDLKIGCRESTSNRARLSRVSLKVDGGLIFVEGEAPLYPKQHS